jgi:hypothetical protein
VNLDKSEPLISGWRKYTTEIVVGCTHETCLVSTLSLLKACLIKEVLTVGFDPPRYGAGNSIVSFLFYVV